MVDALKYGTFDDSGQYRNNLLSENAAVWVPNGRNRGELEKMASKGFLMFYLRLPILWNMLKNFYYLPLGRALRFTWSGLTYFGSMFKVVKSGTRY